MLSPICLCPLALVPTTPINSPAAGAERSPAQRSAAQAARSHLTLSIRALFHNALTLSRGLYMPLFLWRPKDAASRKSSGHRFRTLRRWANRGCYKQPVDKRLVYAACTQEWVSSGFGVFGSEEIKDLACYQHLGKFNSVPGHHISKHLAIR